MPQVVRELVGEYEDMESSEANCARDADKLECMIQGYANSRRRIVTESGQALADAVLATGSLDWLRAALGERR